MRPGTKPRLDELYTGGKERLERATQIRVSGCQWLLACLLLIISSFDWSNDERDASDDAAGKERNKKHKTRIPTISPGISWNFELHTVILFEHNRPFPTFSYLRFGRHSSSLLFVNIPQAVCISCISKLLFSILDKSPAGIHQDPSDFKLEFVARERRVFLYFSLSTLQVPIIFMISLRSPCAYFKLYACYNVASLHCAMRRIVLILILTSPTWK